MQSQRAQGAALQPRLSKILCAKQSKKFAKRTNTPKLIKNTGVYFNEIHFWLYMMGSQSIPSSVSNQPESVKSDEDQSGNASGK